MTDLQRRRIKIYASTINEIRAYEVQVSMLRDYLHDLAQEMSQEDINDANVKAAKAWREGDTLEAVTQDLT